MDNKNTHPTVSVLMSVYNEPLDWIQQAIDSILAQTFTDFEFIIVNDKPDRIELKEFLEQNSANDSRIRVHTNPENIGLTKSLNVGLKLCTGEYIARMDADDVSLPERFAKQVKFMDNYPEIIASSALACQWDGTKLKGALYRPITHHQFVEYILTSSPFIHPLLIIRKCVINRYHIKYDESYKVSQDYKLAADLIKIGQLSNLKEVLLHYRVSNSQISKSRGREQDENGRKIRRELINHYYSLCCMKQLPYKITFETILENYNAKKNHCIEAKNYSSLMNCIRRVLYYSLSDYSISSFSRFILSGDYLHKPYNLRRFIIIIFKHFKQDIVPSLV